MAYGRLFTPKEIHKGLDVNFIDDPGDFFIMTSFDIRFTVPDVEEKISKDAFFTIEYMFRLYLKQSEYKNSILHFGGIDNTGISLNLFEHLDKQKAFDLVAGMCRHFLTLEKGEPSDDALIGKLQLGFDEAIRVVSDYLELIESEGGYTYQEERT